MRRSEGEIKVGSDATCHGVVEGSRNTTGTGPRRDQGPDPETSGPSVYTRWVCMVPQSQVPR